MTTQSEDELSADTRAMLDYRKALDDLRIGQHSAYDRSLIALAPAALGASLVIRQWIVDDAVLTGSAFLVATWILLAVSIAATLVSFQTSAEDVRREIEKLDNDIASGNRLSTHRNIWRTTTVILNWLSSTSFILGVAALISFACVNLPGES